MTPPPVRCDGPGCTTEARTTRDVPRGWVVDPWQTVLAAVIGGARIHRAAMLCPQCQRARHTPAVPVRIVVGER